MQLHILIPSYDDVKADFMMSVVAMNGHLFSNPIEEGMEFTVQNRRGSLIHVIREEMVDAALQQGATHILFLDSDMTFPKDTVNQLYARGKSLVACNYVQRIVPSVPNTTNLDRTGKVYTSESDTGLEEVSTAGLGVAWFDAQVFRDTPRPWFDTYWGEIHGESTIIGEDVFLYMKLRHHGYNLYVDHDLSKSVAHLGQFEYMNFMAGITEEEIQRRKRAVQG